MIITCDNCSTGFNLAEELLNPAGSKVRCSKCGHVFTAYPPDTVPLAEPEPEPASQDFEIFSDESPAKPPEDFRTTSLPESKSSVPRPDVSPSAVETTRKEDTADSGDTNDLEELDFMLDELEQALDEEASDYPDSPPEDSVGSGLEDLEDIDNLLEMDEDSLDEVLSIPTPSATVPAVDDQSADGEDSQALDFELDALDTILDDESEDLSAQTDETHEMAADLADDDLDLDDLEALLEDDGLDGEEPTLVPDFLDTETEGEQETDTPAMALAEDTDDGLTDEFDFSDIEALLDDSTTDDAQEAAGGEDAADDLDLMLDADTAEDSPEKMAEADEDFLGSGEDEFDFSDLESFLDDDTEESEPAAGLVEGLALDQDDDREAASLDDLDLGDLDGLMDEEEAADAADTALESEAAEDGGLELDGDISAELADLEADTIDISGPEEDQAAATPDDTPADDLQAADEIEAEEDLNMEDVAPADEEFDLGELEKVLDMDEMDAATESPTLDGLGISEEHQRDLDELEKLLEIDEDYDGDDLSTVIEPDNDGEDLELDLTEIEKTLEAERRKAKAAEIETGFGEEGLDLDIPEDIEIPDDMPAVEDEEELDLDLELETVDEEDAAIQDTATGEFEIEVEGDEDSEPSTISELLATEKEKETETVSETAFAMGDADTAALKQTAPEPRTEPLKPAPLAPLPRKSGSRIPLILLLLLIIILGAAVVLDRLGIEVPYVHDTLKNVPGVNTLFTQKVADTGNLKLAANVEDSRFLENSKSGRIFVIKGNIRNAYREPRSRVSITGKLFAAGQKPVQFKTIMGGNVLSDIDLTNLPMAEINKRLGKPVVTSVDPGKTLPFMIVFDKLPENLREYTIEVNGSIPSGK